MNDEAYDKQPSVTPDKEAARAFLNALDAKAGYWCFQTFDDNADRRDKELTDQKHSDIDRGWDWLCDLSAKGAGIFVTINETDCKGRKKENIQRVRAVWVDTDGADQDPILNHEPHIVVESSPGNFHNYWLVDDCPLDEFKPAQKRMIEAWGTDKAINDLPRVMRLPGFPHQKVDAEKGLDGTPFMVRMVEDTSFFGPDQWEDRKAKIEALEPKTAPKPKLSERAMPQAQSFAETDLSEVEEMLSYIDPDAGGYGQWCDVLMAIHDHTDGGSDGLALAEQWSGRGAKYKAGEVQDKWRSFTPGGGITKGTIAELARQNGADLSDIAKRHKGYSRPAHTSDGQPRPNSSNDDELDLSHDALANEMGRQGFNLNARFVATWGKWLFWDGTRWVVDERMSHMTKTRDFLRRRAIDLLEWAERKAAQDLEAGDKIMKWAEQEARTLRNKNTVAAVEALARSNATSVASADTFDANRLLLGTPGGTVDLRTGQIRMADRADFITKLTSVAPKQGTPQRWMTFLNEIFDGDVDLINFMQRAAGYALTGETREHKLLFLYGTGRNGKSVFLNTLFDIWGDYSRRAAAQTFLNSQGERHPTDVAGLQGARLVAGSELPKGKTWDESVIKDLTGGDVMTARLMRQDFFDFEPQLTLMIAGNNQPSFRGVDEAIRARVVLVPFTVTIPPERRDKHLPDKLKEEAGQILQWAIDGAIQWRERGLDVPPSVAAASAEYFDDEDTLGQFLQDETESQQLGFVRTSDLHQRFGQWCEDQGLNSWTQRTLQKEVRLRGFEHHRRKNGAGFIGLKLRRL